MSSALCLWKLFRASRKHSGIRRKPFTPESLFVFSPEWFRLPPNAFSVHPGILFVFARNPQPTQLGGLHSPVSLLQDRYDLFFAVARSAHTPYSFLRPENYHLSRTFLRG